MLKVWSLLVHPSIFLLKLSASKSYYHLAHCMRIASCLGLLLAVRSSISFHLVLFFNPFTLFSFYVMFYLLVQDAGVEVDPLGDLNTESERKLGKLVLEK